ncbi:MAG: hypothetical protein K1Y36_26340 [Blastocatellia bacterium]|nr:hypothetical protein [Blastocatellia bacterium]
MTRRWILFMLAGLAIFSQVRPSQAHHAVLRFNLEEMTKTADRIFVGKCVAAQETEDMVAQGMMPVTRYTFEVERAIKGEIPKRLTFQQLGHEPKWGTGKGKEILMHGQVVKPGNLFAHGMSHYHIGDSLVLFLIPNYLGGKVTYPVGLAQGAFYLAEMPSGQKLVRNNINNMGLFSTPYNNFKMSARDAKVIFPTEVEPIAAKNAEGVDEDALLTRRGDLPYDDFVNLVDHIVKMHGEKKGAVIQ